MFSLTIALGSITWRLMFVKEDTAVNAYHRLVGETTDIDPISIEDDFGQTLCARRMSISGFMLEDLDKSALAAIEMGLHQTRTQIKGQQMADADQVIKQARARQNMGVLAPGMGSPMMGGFPMNGRG